MSEQLDLNSIDELQRVAFGASCGVVADGSEKWDLEPFDRQLGDEASDKFAGGDE